MKLNYKSNHEAVINGVHFVFSGGGKDLETVATFGEKKQITPTTSAATITVPAQIGISSPYLSKPVKITLPTAVASSSSASKAVVVGNVKGIGNVNTADGKQIRFIPPKVNTANNRVPPGTAAGTGENSPRL